VHSGGESVKKGGENSIQVNLFNFLIRGLAACRGGMFEVQQDRRSSCVVLAATLFTTKLIRLLDICDILKKACFDTKVIVLLLLLGLTLLTKR
jgi:hypothetical protein